MIKFNFINFIFLIFEILGVDLTRITHLNMKKIGYREGQRILQPQTQTQSKTRKKRLINTQPQPYTPKNPLILHLKQTINYYKQYYIIYRAYENNTYKLNIYIY